MEKQIINEDYDFFSFKRIITIYSDYVTKEYFNISEYYINRIIKAALFLNHKKIGPLIYEIKRNIIPIKDSHENNYLSIKMEKLNELNDELNKENVSNLINTLHKNDWYHGDLHQWNIMVNCNKEIKLIDFDTMFRISKGRKDKNVKNYIVYCRYNNYLDYLKKDDFIILKELNIKIF